MSRAVAPSASMKGRAASGWCSKPAGSSSALSGRATQVWMPKREWGALRVAALVRSEWVTPVPAIIQFTAPGRMIWSVPRLSRCWNSPLKR